MTEAQIEEALAELDRLLNDLDTPMNPDRVWALLAELSPCLREPPGSAVPSPALLAGPGQLSTGSHLSGRG